MNTTCPKQLQSFWPRYSVALLLIVTITACNRKADSDEADIKSIESTISLFSSSLAKADTAALKEICAPGFVLFGEMETYKMPGLFKSIAGISSSTMKREPEGILIATRPEGAWSCYNVSGEVRTEGQSTPLGLIESAYLERTEGRWKIVQVCTIQIAMN